MALCKDHVYYLPPEGCHRSEEGRLFGHKVFFTLYLPLALEVYNGLFIDSLSFLVVDKTPARVHSVRELTLAITSHP